MAKAQCPNCGAEYDPSGISTICSHCLKPLPVAPQPSAPPPPAPAAPPPPAPTAPRPMAAPPAPAPAAATPSADRRPCVKCGEPLYPTEMTCWKCGAAQVQRPAPVAAPPPAPGPYGPPAAGPYPPPGPGPYAPRPPVGPPGAPPAGPYPPPSPYAASTYAASIDPAAQQQAIIALVLGIISTLGLVCCGLLGVLGPVAIALGVSARRKGAGGMAIAGIVLDILGSLALVVMVVMLIISAAMAVYGGGWGVFGTP